MILSAFGKKSPMGIFKIVMVHWRLRTHCATILGPRFGSLVRIQNTGIDKALLALGLQIPERACKRSCQTRKTEYREATHFIMTVVASPMQ
jgi:hypothetical protein